MSFEKLDSLKHIIMKKKFLQLFGGKFYFYAPNGKLLYFSNMKGFKLKEDIRIYSDEKMTDELILIKARQILDFSGTYDVFDSKTGQKLFVLQRKGFKSMIKDEWEIWDENDKVVGYIKEDNMTLALVRRFLTNLIPQSYDITYKDKLVAQIRQHFNPFVYNADLKFLVSSDEFDRRIAIVSGLLLMAIEGRQN